jgi:hypothetical protein
VGAITELFNEGLADPRGCEYREIEIAWGEVTIKTDGWVLPGNGSERFAVGWNGLVYPLKSMGRPASLQSDIPGKNPREGFQGLDNNWPAGDNWSLSTQSLIPIKAALLLRLGHADLAENLWQRGFSQHPDLAATDPYVLMANPWLYALYDRAVRALVNGDDALALQTCRFLLPLQAKAEASAAKRGISKPAKDKLYFEELAQLPELAADQERRAKEAPYTPVLESGLPAQGPERIAALIRDLEQVNAEQMMNPGQTDTYDDPVVQALIKEGDPAVEPLLKCWEEDTRLTRTQFSQGMRFGGPIVHVYEPAYIALGGILGTPFYFSDSDHQPNNPDRDSDPRDRHPRDLTLADRKFLGAKIRAYWEKYKGLSAPEHWYALLQDDNAGPDAWFKSVDRIVQPTESGDMAFGIYGGGMGWGYPLQLGKPMKGESLRSKSNPSVSDLIIKRFEQFVRTDTDKDLDPTNLSKLLLALAVWDGKNHLDDLQRLGQELDAKFVRQTGKSSQEVNVTLCEKRLQLGDSSALRDYVNYLQALTPEELETIYQSQSGGGFFPIMWHYPNDPAIRKVAEKIFTNKGAPLVPIPNSLVPTPLIGLAAFRQELERGLNDTSSAGTVKVGVGNLEYDFTATHTTGGYSSDPPQVFSFAPKPGTVVTFRLCDCYAYQLSQVAGFPECKLYWPKAKRDEAVAVCKTFLEQYGNAYQGRPSDPYDDTAGAPAPGTARFFIPQLDHPATPDDVKAGRALFSLSGTTRVWKMPSYPMGPAWQAEEVFVDGKWERYFGVLGDGKPMKVAASKIDFSGSFPPPGKVTKEISGEIGGPSAPGMEIFNMSYGVRHSLAMNSPLPVTVDISNHSGLDVAVPGSLLLPPGAVKTLPAAIGLSVSYSEKLAPAIQRFSEPIFDPAPYHELPLRKEVVIAPEQPAGSTLYPTQKLTVLKIDLRDFFDMSRPGTYRVEALFHVPGEPGSKSNEVTFSIAKTGN